VSALVGLEQQLDLLRDCQGLGSREGGDIEVVILIRSRPGELLLPKERQRWPATGQFTQHRLGSGIGKIPLQVQMMRRISPGPADPLLP
jgi:hypothetical protein